MKRIILLVPYIGQWPFWFDAFLVSAAKNPTINWLFITDCVIPKKYPSNIEFVKTTLEELNEKINSALGAKVPLTPRKICDIRPAYAQVFEEHINDYDFWGFCDVDIVWGDIRSFLFDDDLDKYDIISSRKNNSSGHFTIFKNQPHLNTLYESIPNFQEKLILAKLQRMDEEGLTEYLHTKQSQSSTEMIKIKWNNILCNQENGRDSHQDYYLDRWLWKDGKMRNTKTGQEVMYLHFINSKRTMKYSEIKYEDNPIEFYISYNGMHYKPHSEIQKIFRRIKNIFNGYEKRMYRKRLVKRIKRKINIKY
jgi:hypothetical protein